MSQIIIYTIITLVAIGAVAAIVLYFVAQRFKVYEDPRIDQVEEALPAANCGGCGFAGCRNFAEALVKSETFDGLHCPVGGNDTMAKVAGILGREAVEQDPLVAVIRCNGQPQYRPRTNTYDGAVSCAVAHSLYTGEGGCPHGCLGCGDCVTVCDFDAIHMNPKTGLPEVVDDNCTACGACVKACPRDIIELRKKNKKDRKIFVSCINEEKGGVAKKYCSVACIGCSKCFKVCPFDAITMENNLAYIDPVKCRLCRKCVAECPTNSILEINFPPPRNREDDTVKAAEKPAAKRPEKAEQKDTLEAKTNTGPKGDTEPKAGTKAEAKTGTKAEAGSEAQEEGRNETKAEAKTGTGVGIKVEEKPADDAPDKGDANEKTQKK